MAFFISLQKITNVQMLKRIINNFLGIRLIKTEKQKDNIAKFCYDVAKVILALTVIGPMIKFSGFHIFSFMTGLIISIIFFIFGNLLDIKET